MVEAHEAVGGVTTRGKPDPNVVLPPAVKKAAERSEELARQAKELRANAPPEPPPLTPAPAPATPSSGVTMTNFTPANSNPPEVAPEGNADNPDWEHQFKSMQGRYEREQENARRMARQIADMQHLMATMNTAPPQPPSQQQPQQQGSGVRFESSVAQPRYVTEQEVQEYGQELMDIVGRRAREVYEPIVAQLANELNQVRQQVGGVRNTVAYDASVKMYDTLAQEVPNWEAINNSAEFGRWLDQPDPLTGQIRRNILNYSHRNNMTTSVIAAFRGFLSDQASFGPANGGTVPGNGAVAASTPQADLARFAAPGRAKTGQTQVTPEKPFFTRADITQFYRDKTAGRYAGREAEADALERSLFEAQREGRIRQQ